jgi:N-methylhydantoinase A
VYFSGKGFLDTPVYDRAGLLAGDRIAGPAIIEEAVATVLLQHGDDAQIAADGSVIIRMT